MTHNPPHPGGILRADYLEPWELSVEVRRLVSG